MRILLVTAESPESRRLRSWLLIQFPQLTMPLIAALTPAEHEVRHTDEIVRPVCFDDANKSHNRIAQADDTVARLHRHGIAAHLVIMFGFDGDDRSIFERTLAFLERSCVDVATVSLMVPMPGTPVFQRLEAEGRLLTRDWSRYDGKRHCVFRPTHMTPDDLVAGTRWVARRFYSFRSIARRLAGSRTGIWWNLPRNVGYHLALRQDAGRAPGPGSVRLEEPTAGAVG